MNKTIEIREYVAPVCDVLESQASSVICSSATVEGVQRENFDW